MTSVKQPKQEQIPQCQRQGLSVRLHQIVQVLYKNNGQFAKGLPSENQFQEMLSHCFNCYDQLDFIILEYSRHPVNYLEPKMVAHHMHRIMRVTKYLLNNLRHWVQSYSLDIVKKSWEEKSYFPTQATHQARCSSCNMYLQEMVLKDAKDEILGWQNRRVLFEEELRQAKEQDESKKQLIVKESTDYVSSVNYLARVIKQMEESAHGYSKITETIEKEENHEDIALGFLEQLLSRMRRRIGEKCIIRIKRVIKNWDKLENEDHENSCKKSAFTIKQTFNENYIPPLSTDSKKNVQANILVSLLRKLKDDNHRLEVEYNNINSAYTAAKETLNFLEKREAIQKQEMERLNDLLLQQNIERSTLIKEFRASRRNTIKPQVEPDDGNSKTKVTFNTYGKQKLFTKTQKNARYSKYNVKRVSRQSEAFNNEGDRTFDFTNGQNFTEYQRHRTKIQNTDSSYEDSATVEVGCQWEDQYCSERPSKFKEKRQRNSKMMEGNRDRMTIPKINKIRQEEEKKLSIPKRPSLKTLGANVKSKRNLKQDYRVSLEDQKTILRDNHTLNKLIENEDKNCQPQLAIPKGSIERLKVSVKLLEGEASTTKLSLEKINIYGNNSKCRELRPILHENKAIIRELPEIDKDTRFAQEIKKIANCRMATEGCEVRKKMVKAKNTLFRPQHLGFFGGVSESYAYERGSFVEEKLEEAEQKYIFVLKNYLANLRNFKNNLYDNIVMFLKNPFSLIDKDELEAHIIGDKQLIRIVSKFVLFHSRKCHSLSCQHLHSFNALIGLPHFQ